MMIEKLCRQCCGGIEDIDTAIFDYRMNPFCCVECWRDNIDGKPAKPKEKKYRPWKQDEVPVGEVVMSHDNEVRAMITASSRSGITVGITERPYLDVLKWYRRADGSPCGAEE